MSSPDNTMVDIPRRNNQAQTRALCSFANNGSGFVKRGKGGSFWERISATKPMHVILAEDAEGHLERSLGLQDLLAIGIGGTVGSGIFVTTGLIAHVYAGPGVVVSWLVGGVICAISGMSYAEMSARLPSAGSTYAYVYYAMGELPAFVAGGLLTLE